MDVDIGFRFRLGRGRRRFFYDRRVALFFLTRRIRDRGFFLLTGREERGPQQKTDVFVHVAFDGRRLLII